MIYALVDKETLIQKGVSLLVHLQHLKTFNNIPILQYRNKLGSLEAKKEDLLIIAENYNGKIIINDSIELIEYVDGLHLGQEDIRKYSEDLVEAVKMIRQTIGSKLLGLSTHDKEEILVANALDLDYIGLGAYRATNTKSDANVGGKTLMEVASYSKHTVGMIGGVRLDDEFKEPISYKVIGSGLYK